MNLIVTCEGCAAIYRVLQQQDGSDVAFVVGEQSEFWPRGYTCPRCGCNAVGSDESSLPRGFQTVDIIDLTVEELLAALHGLGLPNEHKTSLEHVKDVFGSKRLSNIVGYDVVGTGRCCVDYFAFEDGTRVYLGASVHGAVVYRVVDPPTYAKRVMEDADRCA